MNHQELEPEPMELEGEDNQDIENYKKLKYKDDIILVVFLFRNSMIWKTNPKRIWISWPTYLDSRTTTRRILRPICKSFPIICKTTFFPRVFCRIFPKTEISYICDFFFFLNCEGMNLSLDLN